jgi:excinuclease ABC subunit C
MTDLSDKLKTLPKEPGVYFHKDKNGEIIYVGKAAKLNNRVRQYFQKSRARDAKTESLVSEIHDTEWMVVESELEALFLEAEMIRRYMPKYNVLLRDDKSLSYVRINYNDDYPTVSITRRPLDDGARYFGPYFSSNTLRQALKVLRKVFPYATKKTVNQKRASLHYHIGLDPGLEEGRTSLKDYRSNLRKLMSVIEGNKKSVIKDLEKEMKAYSKNQEYEKAGIIRNKVSYLNNLNKQVIFSDKEFLDITKDQALNELVNMLSIAKFPFRIEGYDISHQQGTDVVASMVVFTNGVSNKSEYRKFKTKKDHNNDFYNMHETIKRRLSDKNIKSWGSPDIVLIDGGKGQLTSALKARDEMGKSKLIFIGLAKREEQIVIHKKLSNVELNLNFINKLGGFVSESDEFELINIPHSSNLVKLLQRIRDESHRFAVSYHSTLKLKRQTSSVLDDVAGIGPLTRKKLIKHFGSLRSVAGASKSELEVVLGKAKAKTLIDSGVLESVTKKS